MKIKTGLQTIIIILVCTGYDDVTLSAFLYKIHHYKRRKIKSVISSRALYGSSSPPPNKKAGRATSKIGLSSNVLGRYLRISTFLSKLKFWDI